jgi:hypothetical protein
MPSNNILPKHKVINASAFDLKASAFDQNNYRIAGGPQNDTLSVDTPRGVLAGSVASASAEWEAQPGLYNSPTLLGLFSDNSEGNPYENAPAAASGKVGIFMAGGCFDVFTFETHNANSPYATILASYVLGGPIYASPFGLMTPQQPSALSAPFSAGVNTIVAIATAIPSATALKLGIKLLL